VLAAWQEQGESGGVRTIRAALDDAVSWDLVRQCLREIKRLHRARRRAHEVEHRLSVEVRRRDVMWSMDATHFARLEDGEPIEGQVVRETSTPKILAVEIGAPADGDAVVALLERLRRERGRLPLVLVTDNGSIYTCETVEEWLREHGVVHLLSLPHTPQHNPWVERSNGELKAETGLGRGVVVHDVDEVRERVETARCRLDLVRLRARLEYRTAAAADALLTGWYTVTTRERFFRTVCRRIARALPGLRSERARRKARREAIYATMEQFGLVKRTRGGR
jgi:transposase InsO family protein